MADEINKKISIEVDITDDGQQQISQYKAAFDNLRSSISNLSNPLSALDKSISKLNNSINKLNDQGKSLDDSTNKVKTSVNGLSDTYNSLNKIMLEGGKVLNELKAGCASFEATATAGLSLLITSTLVRMFHPGLYSRGFVIPLVDTTLYWCRGCHAQYSPNCQLCQLA